MEKDDSVPPYGSNSRRCPSVLGERRDGGKLGEVEEMGSHWADRTMGS